MGHTDTRKKYCSDHLAINKYDLSLFVQYKLNHILMYKMSNTIEICFPIFLHFFLATVRLSHHIITLAVKI